eukprot:23443_1
MTEITVNIKQTDARKMGLMRTNLLQTNHNKNQKYMTMNPHLVYNVVLVVIILIGFIVTIIISQTDHLGDFNDDFKGCQICDGSVEQSPWCHLKHEESGHWSGDIGRCIDDTQYIKRRHICRNGDIVIESTIQTIFVVVHIKPKRKVTALNMISALALIHV